MTSTDKLIFNAERYPDAYSSPSTGPRPALGVAIVACMDARIDVHSLFGLELGDTHIIRNAGGLLTEDAIRSLAISQRALGTTEIILVHHTNCGFEGVDDEEFASMLERETGSRPTWRAGGFTDAAADVRLSAGRIRECPYIPSRDQVRGFVFDVDSGRLDEVDL